MENLTTDEAGSRGSEVEAATTSQDVDDLFRTGCGDAASVGVGAGVETVDRFSLISGLVYGVNIFCCVATGGISCSTPAIALRSDASVGRRLGQTVKAKACEVVSGA